MSTNNICSLDFCDRFANVKGYCSAHYEQIFRRGIEPKPIRKIVSKKTNVNTICCLDYCDKPAQGRGYCGTHYAQITRYGLGSPRPVLAYGTKEKKCDAPWCERMTFSAKLCKPCQRKTYRYKITVEQYINLKQVCEVCGGDNKIHIDHNHITGNFRGVLCAQCNAALGLLKENSEIISSLSKYIEERNNV